MKVLVVDEEVPYPLNTGKRLRTFNLLQRLQKQHSITYVCYGEVPSDLPPLPKVEFIPLPSPLIEQKGARFYFELLKNIGSENPYVVDRHYSEKMKQKVQSLLAAENFDLIYCEWTPYTEIISSFLGQYPSVLSTHNVEAQIWQRLWETESNPLKKVYIGLQYKKMLRFEKQAVALYSESTCVSEPDQQLIKDWYGADNVSVVPNGVDEEFFQPEKTAVKPLSMVFTGSMDWRPNQDAMKYFLQDIYPLIQQKIPEVTLTIVGRKPPEWLIELAKGYAGVSVTGTVDDVRPYIAEAALYIVPLRIGGGSRLKILEALSMQKVVLSTTVGAEGLNLTDGQHIVLRDGAEDFAAAAAEILSAPESYADIAAAGRQRALEQYTWDAIAEEMNRVWLRAAGQ